MFQNEDKCLMSLHIGAGLKYLDIMIGYVYSLPYLNDDKQLLYFMLWV